MKKLGKTNLNVSNMGLGCMSMSEFYGHPISDEHGIHLFKIAYKNGVNFFDTADVYAYGRNEILVGNAVSALIAGDIDRNKIIIATKCGINRNENDSTKRGIDNSYQYIKDSCEKSLARLGTEVKLIDLFYLHRIIADGKHQLAAVQSEYSLMTRNVEHNGVLALCKKLGITFIAYSPLSRALLSGEIIDPDKLPENDFRKQLPRFQKQNIANNNAII